MTGNDGPSGPCHRWLASCRVVAPLSFAMTFLAAPRSRNDGLRRAKGEGRRAKGEGRRAKGERIVGPAVAGQACSPGRFGHCHREQARSRTRPEAAWVRRDGRWRPPGRGRKTAPARAPPWAGSQSLWERACPRSGGRACRWARGRHALPPGFQCLPRGPGRGGRVETGCSALARASADPDAQAPARCRRSASRFLARSVRGSRPPPRRPDRWRARARRRLRRPAARP